MKTISITIVFFTLLTAFFGCKNDSCDDDDECVELDSTKAFSLLFSFVDERLNNVQQSNTRVVHYFFGGKSQELLSMEDSHNTLTLKGDSIDVLIDDTLRLRCFYETENNSISNLILNNKKVCLNECKLDSIYFVE